MLDGAVGPASDEEAIAPPGHDGAGRQAAGLGQAVKGQLGQESLGSSDFGGGDRLERGGLKLIHGLVDDGRAALPRSLSDIATVSRLGRSFRR